VTTVFFDIDTQLDFLYPAGALYVPGAERIVPAIARLNRSAAERGIPLVCSMDAHSEDDPEFRIWPPHCVVGTTGQTKPVATMQPSAIILEKQTTDIFETRRLPSLLHELKADRYVVYGVVTEICVAKAARGLLRTGKPVAVVTDAIAPLNPADAQAFFDELKAGGGSLTTLAEVTA
jgi:nicotinamidase/pyrazinamidase